MIFNSTPTKLKAAYLVALGLAINTTFAAELIENSSENNQTAALYTAYNTAEGFDWNDVPDFGFDMPTYGEMASSLATAPQFEVNRDDSMATKAAKNLGNMAVQEGTKYVLVATGGNMAKEVYKVYTNKDVRKGDGSAARAIGNQAKEIIGSIPVVGSTIVDFAQAIKPSGTETLAEAVTKAFIPETSTKVEGTTSQIAGSAARSFVNGYVPFGTYVTGATSQIGQRVFGTSTLTEGLINSSASLFNYWSSTPTDDYDKEEYQEEA